jgi:hypothetical protein
MSDTTIPRPWTRSTATARCPICHRVGCLVAGKAAAVCRHVSSDQQIGTAGWLHVRQDGPAWAPWRMTLPKIGKGGYGNA